MTTKTGNFMIYKLYNRELDDYTTEFFLPDDGARRLLERHLTLASLKEKGYIVAGVLYVDRESYLNARLEETVKEYLIVDRQEEEIRKSYARGMVSLETTVETLELIHDRKWSLLRKIHKQINRMIDSDYSIENEIALMLNDQYLKRIF